MDNYISKCCQSIPNNSIVMSKPALGGEYPGNRKYLISTKEGFLWGICSQCDESSHFKKEWPDNWRETNPEYIWIQDKK